MKSIIRLLTALLLPPEAAGDYVKFIKLQLTELLTQYGAVDLMWFDQYNKITRPNAGRAASVFNSNVTGRPRRSVLSLGRRIGKLDEAY